MAKYIICQVIGDKQIPIINEFGYISFFNSEHEANIERIYNQPDYENALVVKKG